MSPAPGEREGTPLVGPASLQGAHDVALQRDLGTQSTEPRCQVSRVALWNPAPRALEKGCQARPSHQGAGPQASCLLPGNLEGAQGLGLTSPGLHGGGSLAQFPFMSPTP